MSSPTSSNPKNYGGQALIEGVLIRGLNVVSVAIRRPDNSIFVTTEILKSKWLNKLRRIPIIRGSIVLGEMLTIGTRALTLSAKIATEDEPDEELSSTAIGFSLLISLTVGIGLFFVTPAAVTNIIDSLILTNNVTSNIIEGFIRLSLFLGYIILIGFSSEVRRVFSYHGAEHMTIHAFEHNRELTTSNIREYGTPHPRCGTAFLLVVLFIAIVSHIFWTPPILWERVASRIIMLPLITGISYEIIRWSSSHTSNKLVKAIIAPNLMLQSLTTKQPDDQQIEVAVAALTNAIDADRKYNEQNN